jgi:hypothetical protein
LFNSIASLKHYPGLGGAAAALLPVSLPGSATMAVKIDEAWPTDTIACADRSKALVQHL